MPDDLRTEIASDADVLSVRASGSAHAMPVTAYVVVQQVIDPYADFEPAAPEEPVSHKQVAKVEILVI